MVTVVANVHFMAGQFDLVKAVLLRLIEGRDDLT
jgi:hypothetical protein